MRERPQITDEQIARLKAEAASNASFNLALLLLWEAVVSNDPGDWKDAADEAAKEICKYFGV